MECPTVTELLSAEQPDNTTRIADNSYEISDQVVVHGFGVKATRDLPENEEIDCYNGPLVYRLCCSQKEYVLFFIDNTEEGLQCNFLENDSYITWPDVKIANSGRPAIEIGRNCNNHLRFLNHSKENANVSIIPSGFDHGRTITYLEKS